MKMLYIKAIFMNNGEEKVEEAKVPYILKTKQELPKVFPFNQNIYFGPDDGASLSSLYIMDNGDISYFADTIKLNGDKEVIYSPFKNDRIVFIFRLV